MPKALLIIDVQNDFCEGGSLAVQGGAELAASITIWLAASHGDYALVVASADWHVDPGEHFSSEPDYQNTWPPHCVAGTQGAWLHEALATEHIGVLVKKGLKSAAYSAFQGIDESYRSLHTILSAKQIDQVDCVGIAYDYCVAQTALDSIKHGYDTRLIEQLCVGVSDTTCEDARQEMLRFGVQMVTP